jgi:hypothetical protein
MNSNSRALLIGMNYDYFPAHMQLKNSINDVILFSHLLTEKGVPPANIICLTDNINNGANCTYIRIVTAILSLSAKSWQEDLHSVFFLFSGHGSQVKDLLKIEKDGLNEGIGPSDYMDQGLIIDDTLSHLFHSFNPKTKIICIFDCDNSGTMLDLPYYYSSNQNVSSLFMSEEPKQKCHNKIYVFSAAKDRGVSAVTLSDNHVLGSLTSYLIHEIMHKENISLLELQSSYKPQNSIILSSTHPLTDENLI